MSIPKEKVTNSSMDSKDETIIIAQQLKMQFHSTRKGDLETMESYVKKLKSTADSLTAIGNSVSDPDLVLQLLAGLPSPQYLLLKNTISSQLPLPNFSDACSMLNEYEKTTTPAAAAAESSSNSSNSSKSTVEMIHDIAGTVTTVASIARELWNVLGPWSGGSTSGTPPKPKPNPKPNTPGNKKNGRTGGRGNNNRGRGGGPSTRNSGRKQ